MGYDLTDRTAQFAAEGATGTALVDGHNSNDLEDNLSVPGGATGIIGDARGSVKSGDRHFRKAFSAGNAWDIRGAVSCTMAAWFKPLNLEQQHSFSIDDAAGANAAGQAFVMIARETNSGGNAGPWVFMGDGLTRWAGASLKPKDTVTLTINAWNFFAGGYDAARNKLFGAWGRAEGEFYYKEVTGVVGGFGYVGTNTETLVGKFNGEAGTAESLIDHALWFNGRALDERNLRIVWNNHAGLSFDRLRQSDGGVYYYR